MDYKEIESKLMNLKNMRIEHKQGGNFITPNVVGYMRINSTITAEISYGTAFGGGYAVGFTIFKNGRLQKPFDRLEGYDKMFLENEINEINLHAEYVRSCLS